MLNVSRILYCTAFVALCLTATLPAADPIPVEKRLPPSVLAFVTCPNVTDLQNRMHDTSFGEMLQDPGFADFNDDLIKKFEEASEDVEDKIGMPMSDLLAIMSGEASMAVLRPIGQAPGMVVMLDCGDHDDIVNQLLAKTDAELTKQEAVKEVEDIDGTNITIYTIPPQNGRGTGLTVAYFLKDHTLAIGSSLAVLETILERWDGSDPNCFAENEHYKAMLSQCITDPEAKPVLKWFVTPIELIMAGLSLSPETQMYAGIGSAYLPTLGLNRLKAIGGTTELATDEYDHLTKTVVITNPPASGLIKVFQFPDTLTTPPNWVPADAAQYMAMHWDIDGAYHAIGAIYDTFQGTPGAWEQFIDAISQQPGGPGLHLKDDVIDTLTGQVQGYMIIPAGADINASDFQPQGIVAIAVTDAVKAQKLLNVLVAEKGDVTSREFKGVTVYEVAGDKTAAFAVVHNHIFLAENVQRLESAIIGETANPLAKSPAYQAVAAHMPEKKSMTSWVDAALQWEAGYEKLRAGAFDNALEGALDFGKLPPFETLRKYMRPTASYMVPTEKGSMTVNFTLRPKR